MLGPSMFAVLLVTGVNMPVAELTFGPLHTPTAEAGLVLAAAVAVELDDDLVLTIPKALITQIRTHYVVSTAGRVVSAEKNKA